MEDLSNKSELELLKSAKRMKLELMVNILTTQKELLSGIDTPETKMKYAHLNQMRETMKSITPVE